jgi:hypothetical protein
MRRHAGCDGRDVVMVVEATIEHGRKKTGISGSHHLTMLCFNSPTSISKQGLKSLKVF